MGRYCAQTVQNRSLEDDVGQRVIQVTRQSVSVSLRLFLRVREEFRGGDECVEFHVVLGEVFPCALLAVDDDENALDSCPRFPERFDRIDRALAGRGDILQNDHLLARLERTLDPVARPVGFGFLADDDVGKVGSDARGRRQWDRPECDASERGLTDALGESVGDHPECVGIGLEDVLVDVVVTRPAVGEFELTKANRPGLPKHVDECLCIHICGHTVAGKGLADCVCWPVRGESPTVIKTLPRERNHYGGRDPMLTRMHVFGSSGVRGVALEELTPAYALEVAQAAGSVFAETSDRVAVGRDTRETGRLFVDAVSSGLASVGVDVDRVGVVPTPALQTYCKQETVPGVMVTASHNPPQFNGIKLCGADGVELTRDTLDDVERRLADGVSLATWAESGQAREVDGANRAYREQLLDAVDRETIADADLTVALDPGHGSGALTSPDLFRDLGCHVKTINAQPDGSFPGRNPEPVAENLDELGRLVRTGEADIGIAHDGDGDRAMFFDETGEFVEGDAVLAALTEAKLSAGETVVSAVNTSQRLVDVVEQAGGKLDLTPIGSTHIITEIRERQAAGESVPIAGEGNGGIIFPDYFVARDGAYTAAMVCELAATATVSELVAPYGGYANVRYNIAYDDSDERAAMIAAIERIANVADAEVETTDGYRLDYGDAWVLARPSGTEPVIRLYAEARDRERAEELVGPMLDTVKSVR